jgi:4'-phosphopantetheinyl transferase EntD
MLSFYATLEIRESGSPGLYSSTKTKRRRRRRRPITLSAAESGILANYSNTALKLARISRRRRVVDALDVVWNNTSSIFFFIFIITCLSSSCIVMRNQLATVLGASRVVAASSTVAFATSKRTTQQRRVKSLSFSTTTNPIFRAKQQQQQQSWPRIHRFRHQTFARSTKSSSQEAVATSDTTNYYNTDSNFGASGSRNHIGRSDTSSSSGNAMNNATSSSVYHLQPARIGGCHALLDLELPEGRCIGLQLADNLSERDALTAEAVLRNHHPNHNDDDRSDRNNDHWLRDLLHPQEIDFGLQVYKCDAARQSFWMGRMALRRALEVSAACQQTECSLQLLQQLYSMNDFKHHHRHQQHHHQLTNTNNSSTTNNCIVLLKDEYGRPNLPPGALGSISHKKNTAVALVQCRRRDDDDNSDNDDNSMQMGIGVDLELTSTAAGRPSIARKIWTPNELSKLGQVAIINDKDENSNGSSDQQPLFMSIEEEVLLRFSIKEALYKAMHPLINQYVSFQEAETQPLANGTFAIHFQLKSGAHEQFQHVTAHWRRIKSINGSGDFFLTSASVQQPKKAKKTT